MSIKKLMPSQNPQNIEGVDIQKFLLNQSLFVAAIRAEGERSEAWSFNERELVQIQVQLKLQKIFLESGATFKLIGPLRLQALVKKWMGKIPSHLLKVVIRESSAEILFYPAEGRVRLSKEAIHQHSIAKDQIESTPKVLKFDTRRIRILIVDDSKTIRDLLQRVFAQDPALEVIAATGEPLRVMDMVEELKPDLITMDIHMPDMDGCTLVKKIMAVHSTPIVMISSVTMEEGSAVFDALDYGAVDYIPKPTLSEMAIAAPIIIEKMKSAARANVHLKHGSHSQASPNSLLTSRLKTDHLIAIGSSTGGTEGLRVLLTDLPAIIPPTVIVQHIPPVLPAAFAQRMDKLCKFEVKEAAHGDLLLPNRVLIAPGGKQMEVVSGGNQLSVRIHDGPAVNRFKPSVDVLFDSVAKLRQVERTGIILTGMGNDGAQVHLRLKNSGAKTIGQSEKTCVVYGMPREAELLGAVDDVLDIEKIASHLIRKLS